MEFGNGVVTRPGTVSAAGVLWIVLGVWLTIGGVATALGLGSFPSSGLIGGITALVGLALWWFGLALRRGADVRIPLTVLGGVSMLMVFPIFIAVPAIVLQFLPESRRWFELTPAPGAAPPPPIGYTE